MATTWTIAGALGSTWNATQQTFEYRGIKDATLTVGSFDQDAFEWTQTMDSLTSYGSVPDWGQLITIRRGSTVWFQGHISTRRIDASNPAAPVWKLAATGPWDKLRKAPLTGTVDAVTRASVTLASATATDQISAILSRAAAVGLPVYFASASTNYALPQMTLSGQDFLSALAEVMRLVPDAVGWWSYSGTGSAGFNLTRRASATVTTLALGAGGIVRGADLNPRVDLSSPAVAIDFSEATGGGTAGAAAVVRGTQGSGSELAQRMVVSGAEKDTFLPELTDPNAGAIYYQKALAKVKDAVVALHPVLRELGGAPSWVMPTGMAEVPPPVVEGVGLWPAAGWFRADTGARISTDSNGMPTDGNFQYFLAQGTAADWVPAAVGAPTKVFLRARATANFSYGAKAGTGVPTAVLENYNFLATWQGYNNAAWETWNIYYFLRMAVEAELVGPWLPSGWVHPAPAYDFVQPPAGLATNLTNAQAWTPHEGRVEVSQEDPGATVFAGRNVRISGGYPGWALMDALVRAHRIDFASHRETVECGAPDRLGRLSVTTRFPKPNGQDNIIWR